MNIKKLKKKLIKVNLIKSKFIYLNFVLKKKKKSSGSELMIFTILNRLKQIYITFPTDI